MIRSRSTMAWLVAIALTSALAFITWRTGALASAATRTITWSKVASQPFGTVEASGIELGGKLYSFGGYDPTRLPKYTPTSRAYAYTPSTNTWAPLRALPAFNGTGKGGVTHAGIATDGSSIYLAGGYSSDASGNAQIFGARDVYRYDPGADTYTRLPDLPAERAAGGLAYVGGELHFFGGTNRTRKVEAPEHWALTLSNLSAGWVKKAPLPNPRNHLGAAVVGGKIYAIGGQTGQDAPAISSRAVNAYDPATNTWSTKPSLPLALSHTVATDLNGELVVLGGQTAYNQVVGNTYSFDPLTNTWTAMTPLPVTRFSGVTGVIAGRLYYAGGSYSPTTYRGTPSSVPPTTGTTPPPTTPPADGTARFNMQPAASATPATYVAETGLAYTDARGRGFVREDSLGSATHVGLDLSANTRERGVAADQRLDTLVHLNPPASSTLPVKTPGAWEYAVPNGSYEVTVAVGDPSYFDGIHTIRVEGTTAINGFVPTSATRSASGTVTVTVTDGRLTIDAVGGTNTKLDYVTVRPVAG